MHGKRRRGHQEVHHHIGYCAAKNRPGKTRLAHDFAQRAPARFGLRRRLGGFYSQQDQRGYRRHQPLSDKGHRKGVRRPQIHGRGHQHRADDPRRHAAAHNQRERPRAPLAADAVGSGKAEGHRHRRIGAAEKGRETEQPERSDRDRQRRQRSRQHAGAGTDHKDRFAPASSGQRAKRQNTGRHPQHKYGDGQRGQRRRGRDGVAHNRPGGVKHHRVCPCERLRRRQANNILVLLSDGQRYLSAHDSLYPEFVCIMPIP